jgi:hypothetical protein
MSASGNRDRTEIFADLIEAPRAVEAFERQRASAAARRDAAVRDAYALGVTVPTLATLTGLSEAWIKKLVADTPPGRKQNRKLSEALTVAARALTEEMLVSRFLDDAVAKLPARLRRRWRAEWQAELSALTGRPLRQALVAFELRSAAQQIADEVAGASKRSSARASRRGREPEAPEDATGRLAVGAFQLLFEEGAPASSDEVRRWTRRISESMPPTDEERR